MQWHIQAAFVVRALGTTYSLIVASIMVSLLLWFDGRERDTLLLLSSVITTAAIVKAIKVLTNKPRPKDALVVAHTGSFPSGHATMSVTSVILLLYLFYDDIGEEWRIPVTIALFFVAFLIAASRIILRVHTLTEVVVGVLLGAAVPLGLLTVAAHFGLL